MTTGKAKVAFLAGLVGILLLYVYVTYLVGPARAEAERLRRETEVSREKIRIASGELAKLRAKEMAALAETGSDQRMQKLLETMPNPYWVDAPRAISRLLEERELQDARVKLLLMLPLRGLPDHLIAGWSISIPKAHAYPFGEALAELENRFPLGRLTSLSLQATDDSGTVDVSMVFKMAVHQ